MILWVLIQGFRIITGRSRDSTMVLVTNMARAALIISVATTMGMFGRDISQFLTQDVGGLITHAVTGKGDSAEDQIDKSLAWMQVALSSIDAIKVLDDPGLQQDKTRAMWFIGVGTRGPAVTAGSMLLLYQVAMALFIGLGPLFILCLLFDQTKQLFQKWLFYGIGTMFSMAVLAAMFLQGTLGGFMAYSQIGGGAAGQPSASGQPPGSHTLPAPERSEARGSDAHGGSMVRSSMPQTSSGEQRVAPSTLGAASFSE